MRRRTHTPLRALDLPWRSRSALALAGLAIALLAACGHYGPPKRGNSESRLEASPPARVEAGPASEECEEAEEEGATKKNP